MAETKVQKKKTTKKPATAKKSTTSKAPRKSSGGFAVIETGGKQYKVKEGEYFRVEKLGDGMKVGDKIKFDKVLLIDDGKTTKIGDPYIKGKIVEAVLEEEGRAKKVTVIRYKSKSRYFKKKGHRQPYMQVRISKI